MGCGACTTVCPSGALGYAYPTVPELSARIRTALATYGKAGGRDPCLLFHDAAGAEVIHRLGRRGKGLPARVIPVELHHMAATGIDVWLGALAYGASDVAVLRPAPRRRNIRKRSSGRWATPIRSRRRLATGAAPASAARRRRRRARGRRLGASAGAAGPRAGDLPLVGGQAHDRRARHRASRARADAATVIALAAGAPFGTIAVNRDACTLCLACVGACPKARSSTIRPRKCLSFALSSPNACNAGCARRLVRRTRSR
jgi:ferredoxin